ncbi:transglutaminase-like domain-containing protein [Sphingomonas crocodyli]|uniref:Transglutaminase family protein n=1 Tax=Sphingomonas crocodyli TaxID=1979270 RepID=A0A437LYQ2_9SPHN|nr:transglutaminase family protein [Sphingomonas crocodyli]RVT90434.1 transglutaminase family protein [Sphingomonas crocodyli]
MRLRINATLDYCIPDEADILLTVEAARTAEQIVLADRLDVVGSGPLRPIAGEDHFGRRVWTRAHGPFNVHYAAEVDLLRASVDLADMRACRPAELPAHVIPYLWPSRYCEADRFEAFVAREFAAVAGGRKILAMAEWIYRNVDYRLGTSDGATTAVDAFVKRQGVCRDFAHLLASFARAADIPARLVSAYAYDLEPSDFHAVVEVWLGGEWHLVDPTRLAPLDGLVKIAVGRDATDIAFMTIFGTAQLQSQSIEVEQVPPSPTSSLASAAHLVAAS